MINVMAEKRILIAGLPDAGKSSYIGALNGVMSQDGECSITRDDKGTEWAYVNGLTEKWFDCEVVEHSSDGETKYIQWPLRRKDGQEIKLTIPDMKGEVYYDIINDDFDPQLAEFCKDAQGILFFINKMNRFQLKDHLMVLINDEGEEKDKENNVEKTESISAKAEADKIKLNISTMPDMTKNLLVIKYLRELMGDVKIAIAISAWDERSNYNNVEDFFKTVCPAIYNYVRYNFHFYRFFGVSAQGAKYGTPGIDLNSLTEKGERSFVYTDRKMYNLAAPLDYLIQ